MKIISDKNCYVTNIWPRVFIIFELVNYKSVATDIFWHKKVEYICTLYITVTYSYWLQGSHVADLIEIIPKISRSSLNLLPFSLSTSNQDWLKFQFQRQVSCKFWANFLHKNCQWQYTGPVLIMRIEHYHKAPVPYPTMHHSEQKCAHFCSEWCIVGCGIGALWDLWIWSIGT